MQLVRLTKEQIAEIAKSVASVSIKDTDFPEASQLSGDEFVAIVQDGINKKMSLLSALEQLLAAQDETGVIGRLDNIEDELSKIGALEVATHTSDGLMSAEDKVKLDSLGIHYNTTDYWNSQLGYIPSAGEIIIYSDYKRISTGEKYITIPGIKIGSGNGYVQDLAFLGDAEAADLMAHINNTAVHTSASEKLFWNRKLNVNDSQEVVEETLIFNRN